jgi:cell division protein FtsQ
MWNDARLLNATANALFGLAAALLITAAVAWLIQRPFFTLKTIRVEAQLQADGSGKLEHVNAATMRAGALPRIRGNFFTADLDGVRQAFEGVPWVRRAAVRREWPNALVVTIEEQRALGTWGDGRLLNPQGEIFVANLAEAEGEGPLPAFAGPPGTEKEVTRRYYDFIKWFAPVGAKPVQVVLTQRYAWQVKLDTGTTLELGREQDNNTLASRVERFVRAWPQLARLTHRADYVDLRYANGFALRAPGLKILDESKQKSSRRT